MTNVINDAHIQFNPSSAVGLQLGCGYLLLWFECPVITARQSRAEGFREKKSWKRFLLVIKRPYLQLSTQRLAHGVGGGNI